MAIKLFHSGQAGAPSLTGQNGSLIALFDALLVNGYNAVSVTSITRVGGVATVQTDVAHGFKSGESALISGATEAAYNIDAVVSVIDLTHFTYQVAGEPASPATGSVTVKRAPAGFSKAFSATNKAAYRPNNTDGTRPYLQVIDDGSTAGAAREAKVRGYLTMTDVDTGGEPFPTAAQAGNGLYAHKSCTVDSTDRPWTMVTDGDTVYFQACMDRNPSTRIATDGYIWWLAFGDFIPTRPNDPFTAFIAANNLQNGQQSPSNTNGLFWATSRNTNPSNNCCYSVRSYAQTIGAANMAMMGHGWDQSAIGSAEIVKYPHQPDNGFLMTPVMCVQGGVFRGRMPGIFEPLQGRCLSQFDTIENVDGYPGRTFLALIGVGASSNTGMLMFDITGNESGKWD